MEIDLEDFQSDFYGALEVLTNSTIARVERETAGMSEMEIKQYWVDRARQHLAKVEQLNAPDCIIERARSVLARREAALAALPPSEGE